MDNISTVVLPVTKRTINEKQREPKSITTFVKETHLRLQSMELTSFFFGVG
jgi:hypothetical protein